MCLFSKQQVPKVAVEDIECFKILKELHGAYYTPYRDTPVKFNELMETGRNPFIIGTRRVYDYYVIEEGYFHSCSTKEFADKEFNRIKIGCFRDKVKLPKLHIFKAIIPKGTHYYVGVNGDLCSDKLIIMK